MVGNRDDKREVITREREMISEVRLDPLLLGWHIRIFIEEITFS